MREIKFRAWNINKKEMRLSPPEIQHLGSWFDAHLPGAIAEVENIALMQFTGLKDKNGKEIYEGDILKKESFLTKIIDNSKVPHSDHVNYCLVEFNSDKKVNGWQLKTIKTTRSNNFGLGHISSSFLYTYTDKAEIIGNIYENPELLS